MRGSGRLVRISDVVANQPRTSAPPTAHSCSRPPKAPPAEPPPVTINPLATPLATTPRNHPSQR